MTTLVNRMESKANPDELPHRWVTADEFRAFALEAGWRAEVIEAFLVRPYLKQHVKVGGQMLRVA